MDTSWWLALVAVMLLALVAALVDGWGRGSRPARRRFRSTRHGADGLPRPAEIWWAEVPYEDGPGSEGAARGASGRVAVGDARAKDRPCLVLMVRGNRVTVAKITSKYHGQRAGVIPLPPGAVDDVRGRPSFLETHELRQVRVRDFRRRVGVVDPALWDQVRHLTR